MTDLFKNFIAHAVANPKTTIQGMLTAVIGTTIAIAALPPKAGIPVIIVSLCKAWIGMIQTDAQKP